MSNILDRYGIKEVADVTFYKLNNDGSRGAPVLFLDTLKISNIEQTAENSSAKGGKGNADLVMWDHSKEINVTLEDALFSMKSLGVMCGLDEPNKVGVPNWNDNEFQYIFGEIGFGDARAALEDCLSKGLLDN